MNEPNLFNIIDPTPPGASLLIFMMLLFTVDMLASVWLFFEELKLTAKIGALENFLTGEIHPRKKVSRAGKVDSALLLAGLVENRLVLDGKTLEHGGVYFIQAGEGGILEILEKAVQSWNRPVLFLGRSPSCFLTGPEITPERARKLRHVLSGKLFTFPAIGPKPDLILKAALGLKEKSRLGAVIIEDMEYKLPGETVIHTDMVNRLEEISRSLHIPVLLMG